MGQVRSGEQRIYPQLLEHLVGPGGSGSRMSELEPSGDFGSEAQREQRQKKSEEHSYTEIKTQTQ